MTAAADFVLLTRFNLPSVGVEELIRAEEGWLRDRVELFEKYCFPSVVSQSDQDFHWIVYFDPESPAWLQERIRAYRSALIPVFRATVSPSELLEDLRRVTGAGAQRLITANLDNDDALASDFVARLHQAQAPAPTCALYLSTGLIQSSDKVFLRHDPQNAFCAVTSPWTHPVTCWAEWHNRLERLMPVLELRGDPAWLQVVHGRNVSNRVRGKLTSPIPYRTLFPGQLDALEEPLGRMLLHDRLVAQPKRWIRDSGRRLAKEALLLTLGRDGFDRSKAAVAGQLKRLSNMARAK